jgi:hypothetical protein
MVAADVIKRVAGHAEQGAFGHQAHIPAQAEMAKARVEEKVTVAAADMPHVAAEEGLDPGFVDQRDSIGHADRYIPVFGGDWRHGYFASTIRLDMAAGVTVSPTATSCVADFWR